jgi:hypothetical protein
VTTTAAVASLAVWVWVCMGLFLSGWSDRRVVRRR